MVNPPSAIARVGLARRRRGRGTSRVSVALSDVEPFGWVAEQAELLLPAPAGLRRTSPPARSPARRIRRAPQRTPPNTSRRTTGRSRPLPRRPSTQVVLADRGDVIGRRLPLACPQGWHSRRRRAELNPPKRHLGHRVHPGSSKKVERLPVAAAVR